jgi:transposase InsO family protein
VKYAFVQTQIPCHPITLLCYVLKVNRSGYYRWQRKIPSQREQADKKLLVEIQRVHTQHRKHAGALKTWHALKRQGIACGKHQVARLRRINGIVAKRRKRFVVTTRSKHTKWVAPNLLQRDFAAQKPNQVWVGDVTFVPTQQGWLYLAVLIDLYSRQVIGWSMSNRNDTPLVLGALQMAIVRRQPGSGLIHHSDQGQTYAAQSYRDLLAQNSMTPSMSRKGDCWDNAVAESFFATLEFELIEQQVFPTRDQARSAIFEYIEVSYNRQRAHQTLDYRTPLEVDLESVLCA